MTPWLSTGVAPGYHLDGGASASASDSKAEPPVRMATIAAVDPSYFAVLDAPVLAGPTELHHENRFSIDCRAAGSHGGSAH
jgi:hypothetical protein